jgi:hypothetical protein
VQFKIPTFNLFSYQTGYVVKYLTHHDSGRPEPAPDSWNQPAAAWPEPQGTGVQGMQLATPQAQVAFEALNAANHTWRPNSWNAMNDYVDFAQRSGRADMRHRADAARTALGPRDSRHQFQAVSETEHKALLALLRTDLRRNLMHPPGP